MTLDEAIKHSREKAEKQRHTFDVLQKGRNKKLYSYDDVEKIFGCIACAEEHEQLAEWLEELKDLRKWKEQEEKACDKFYNKAVDDFIPRLLELDNEFPIIEDEYGEKRPMYLSEMCKLVAEQLKAGVNND